MSISSATYINLNLSTVNSAVVVYAKQNDRLSRHIVAAIYDGSAPWNPPAGSAAMIRYHKPDGTVGFYDVDENGDPAVSISDNVATLTIVEQALTVPGDVWMELNFYNTGDEKLTTLYWLMRVQKSVLDDGTVVSSDYYNILTAEIAAVLGATANPPQIDPITKNWLLWDEDQGQYVDSGFSSVGTTGPAPLVTSTTNEWQNSNSGTTIPTGSWSSTPPATSPGTWRWTKTTTVYDTGDSVVTYTAAYQGQDGSGSPGTSTPKVDSGSGVVGTATAYSREDHQHPLNVSANNPADLGTASPGTSSSYSRDDHVHKLPTPAELGVLALVGSQGNYNPVSDLDDFITGIGVFYDYEGTTIDHFPYNASTETAWALIIGAGDGNNTGVQVAFDLQGIIHPRQRMLAGGTWGGWSSVKSSATALNGLVPVANGGTYANNAADARTNLSVDEAGKVTISGTEYTLQLGSYSAGAAGTIRFSTT